jgi:hypothetical protein
MAERKDNSLPIQCPNCGTAFDAPVTSMIDVGAAPQLRQLFLSGQLNVAMCPNCKTGGLLEVPLVYHDPEAEFFAVYFPQQLQIPEPQKQKMIGDLTQSLMRTLPPEQRKGYFLNPRQFVNRQSLMDAVLGTMGISQEELDRQRKKAKLVEQLMVFADDPKGLQMMIKGQDAQLDMEFFSILNGMLEQAAATGDEKSGQRLELLRDTLMPITSFGKKATKQRAAVESLKDVQTPEAFLDRVVAADADEATAIAVAARPAMDYKFFEGLTGLIEAAQGGEKDRLTQLREHLLTLTGQLDQAARQGIEEAVEVLGEIINSASPRTEVRQRLDQVDEVFMQVLSANMQEAERKGNRELMSRLGMVYEEIMSLYEQSLPPEIQLLNELLEADYPEETRAMLKENREKITPEIIDLMAQMADEMAGREGEDAANTVKRLRDIRSQAMLMI